MKEFGEGRKAVIYEMIRFVENEIIDAKAAKALANNSHKEATISGFIQGMGKTKQKLKVKLKKTLEF